MPTPEPVLIASDFKLERVSVCQRGINPASRISVLKAEKDPAAKPPTISEADKALNERMEVLERENAALRAFAAKAQETEERGKRAGIVAKAASLGVDAAELEAFLAACQKAGLGDQAIGIFGKAAATVEKSIPTTPLGHSGAEPGGGAPDAFSPAAQAYVNKHLAAGAKLQDAVLKAAQDAEKDLSNGNGRAAAVYNELLNFRVRA